MNLNITYSNITLNNLLTLIQSDKVEEEMSRNSQILESLPQLPYSSTPTIVDEIIGEENHTHVFCHTSPLQLSYSSIYARVGGTCVEEGVFFETLHNSPLPFDIHSLKKGKEMKTEETELNDIGIYND